MTPFRTHPILAARGFWLAVYLGAVLTPLVVLIVVPTPAKYGYWWDIGIGLGFAGLVMMGIQFLLTARYRHATAPFGIDLVYYFHRYLAYVLLVVVLGHPVVLIAVEPSVRYDLNPLTAPWPMTAGVASLVLLLAIVVTSAGRKLLRIPYDVWRYAHLILDVAAVALAFAHMRAIGYYSGTPAASALWTVIGLSLLLTVLRVRVLRPWQLLRRPYRVAEVKPEPGSTWTLAVEPEGHAGFDFQPGQFVWLSLRRSPFAMKEHPFSIVSAPRAGGRLEFAIKERGDFTRTIGEIQPGEVAYVDGPYGVFSLDRHPDAAGYIFLSGGIGVAPMMGMIRTLADRKDSRRHVLFAAHSRLDRIPFLDELRDLQDRLELTVVHVLEDPPEGWTGERGYIDRAMLERHLPADRNRYEYFICGPVPMIRTAERCLHELGVPSSRLHTELFDLV
jgi:predicted ferric reductase